MYRSTWRDACPIDLISIIFPHQLIQIRDNDTDPCPGQSRLAANIRKLVYKNNLQSDSARQPACLCPGSKDVHTVSRHSVEKNVPVFLHLNVQSQLKSNDLSYIHYWKMREVIVSISLACVHAGAHWTLRPLDSATYASAGVSVFLFSSLGIWQAASCTLYTWPATGHLVFTAPEEMKLAAQQVTTIHGCAPELGIPGQNITPGQCPLIFTQVS